MGKKSEEAKRVDTATAEAYTGEWIYSPASGNYLTIVAAVAVQFSIIMLPLVGPAGSAAPHAVQNMVSWVSVVVLAMALSALALYSKIQRRKRDGSPLPILSFALLGVAVILFCAFLTGALSV